MYDIPFLILITLKNYALADRNYKEGCLNKREILHRVVISKKEEDKKKINKWIKLTNATFKQIFWARSRN